MFWEHSVLKSYLRKTGAVLALKAMLFSIFLSSPVPIFAGSSPNGSSTDSSSRLMGESFEAGGGKAQNNKGNTTGVEEDDELQVGKLKIRVPKEALDKRTKIHVRPLKRTEVPKMKQGMENLTADFEGYEFTPHGTKFKKPVKIYMPYDLAYLPEEMGEENIFTYFYDEDEKQWVQLERVEIDRKNQLIVSITTHFTKMVNATLTLPESPQLQSFNPNSLKDIKAADPSAGIFMMEAPKPGSMGSNNLNFPIEVPPGRGGMAPQLALAYSNGGGNGLFGVGWDMSVPSITHDSKYGVPKYDGTDIYLLNGSELVPIEPNGNNPRQYRLRVEGSYQKILRHGTSAANYKWEVIDKNGNTTFYGYSDDSKVASNRVISGIYPVYQWNITANVDLSDNCVQYNYYNNVYDPDKNASVKKVIAAREVYLSSVQYPGVWGTDSCTPDTNGYRVELNHAAGRNDIQTNGRGRFKTITRKKVTGIEVKYNTERVRRYQFTYSATNSARKTRLDKVEVFNSANVSFYDYTFEYEDMTPDSATGIDYVGFTDAVPFSGGMSQSNFDDQGIGITYFTDLIGMFQANQGPGVSYSENYSMSIGFDGGFEVKKDLASDVGTGVDLSLSTSGSTGASSTYMGLIDLNGDNLPDQVIKNAHYNNGDFLIKRNTGSSFAAKSNYPSEDIFPSVAGGPAGKLKDGMNKALSAIMPIVSAVKIVASILKTLLDLFPVPGVTDSIRSVVSSIVIVADSIQAFGVVMQVLINMPFSGVKEDASYDSNKSLSFSGGVTAKAGSDVRVTLGGNGSFSETESRVSYQDINADGFIDQMVLTNDKLFADNGTVLYKFNDGTSISRDNAPVISSPTVTDIFMPDDVAEETRKRFFHVDSVRRWTAPKSGVIIINGSVKKLQHDNGDGVYVYIRHEKINTVKKFLLKDESKGEVAGNFITDNNEDDGEKVYIYQKQLSFPGSSEPIWKKTIAKADDKKYAHSIELKVERGDSIAFRVNAIEDIEDDTVEWISEISYKSEFRSDGLIAADYPCDPLIDDRCIKRGKDYVLPEKVVYKSDGDFYLAGYLTNLNNPDLGDETDVTKLRAADNTPQTIYDKYDDYGYINKYLGWSYEEWNAYDDSFLSDMRVDLINSKNISAHSYVAFISRTQMAPSRKGENYIADNFGSLNPNAGQSGSGGSGATTGGGSAFIRKSQSNTWGANLSISVGQLGGASGGGSYSSSDTTTHIDWADMNGDRYPDMVKSNGAGLEVAYNLSGNGFAGFVPFSGGYEEIRKMQDSSISVNAGGNAHVRTINAYGDTKEVKPSDSGSSQIKPVAQLGGLSASATFGQSLTRIELMDVNGDGLPDHVTKNNNEICYRMNLGKEFSSVSECRSTASVPTGSVGDYIDDNPVLSGLTSWLDGPELDNSLRFSTTYSQFASISQSDVPLYDTKPSVKPRGGVNSSKTYNRSFVDLSDINGDGLPDILVKLPGQPFLFYINYGDSFSSTPIKWNPGDWGGALASGQPDILGYSWSTSINASAGIEIPVPIPIPFLPFDLRGVITPTLSASYGSSSGKLSFQDINGDGLPDHLYQKNGTLYAKLNNAGRVNLLKKVKGPLGMEMAFEYQRKGNTVENPNSQYVLTEVTVTNSISTKIVRDDSGQIIKNCTDPLAAGCIDTYTTTFEYGPGRYDRHERVFNGFAWAKETSPIGTYMVTHYLNGYDDEHSLDQELNLANSVYTKNIAFAKASYDTNGDLIRKEATEYELRNGQTGDNGVTIAFPAAVEQTFIYYEDHGTKSKENLVTFQYDNFGNVTEEIDYGDDNADDTTILTITYSSDQANYIIGKPATVEVRDEDDNLLRKRSAVYDTRGRLTQFAAFSDPAPDAQAAVSTITYDPVYGNMASLTGANGYTLIYSYETALNTHVNKVEDSFGLNSRSEDFDYKFGVFRQSFDTNNKEIRFEYDDYGRMKKVWGPYNIGSQPALEMEYHPEYKGTGSNKTLPHAITKNLEDHEGTRTIDTVIFVDSLKRVIQTQKTSEVYQDGQPVVGMTATGRVVFDLMGRVTDQGQPVFISNGDYSFEAIDLVNATKFTYDDQGRTTGVVTPDNNTTITSYTIDENWMKTTVTDPNGNMKDSYSDLYSKIIKVIEYGNVVERFNNDGTPVFRQHDIETNYEYSPVGDILRVIDENENPTTVTYDLLGRRTSIDNKDTGLTSFAYDIAGNLIEKRTANMQGDKKEPIRYEYDYNRLLKINYPGDETDVVYTYGEANAPNNRAGRVLSVSDDSGLTELSYGSLGEVLRTDKTITTRSGQTKTYTTRQSYDSFGRMKELVYPDGEVLRYTYDAGGLLQSATGFKDRVTYNYLNYLGYDHFGQRVYMELGNKTRTSYQYDQLTRRMSHLQTEGKEGKLQDISYTYDHVGNILSITDSARNSVTQNFTYDGLYRLVSADGIYDSSRSPDGRTHSYSRKYRYDDIHNMVEKRATSEINTKDSGFRYPKEQNYILEFDYSSDKPHQLAMVTERDPRGVRKNSIDQYTFDAAGNLETKLSHTDGKRRDLKWTAENRLQEVHQHGKVQKYTYNADGDRIKKEGNNGESIYVNQFYHVRNSLLSFKHIYAGNTRIATKVVPAGNRPHKNRTQGNQNKNQINLVGDPMQLDTAKVNQQLNLNGHSTNNGAGQGNGHDQNTNGKSNNGNKGNSGNNNGNNGNQSQGNTHDNSDVVIPPDCAFPIDQVRGNVTQQQVDNWCRRNAGINPGKGNAWGRNNNNNNNGNNHGNNANINRNGNNKQNNPQSQDTGTPTGNNSGNQGNAGPQDDNNGQGPVNAQGNAYAWGWYANKDEYRTPPGKSRGKGTTGLKEPKIYFYHGDHLGSANYVTDVIGEVFEHTINFPFGEIWIDEGSNTSLLGFKFTGKELDEETGYIYFGARYYDPKVSVWVSTDPALGEYLPTGTQLYFPDEAFNARKLKGAGGVFNSVNLNTFHYAGLNPVIFHDPDGRVIKFSKGENATDVDLANTKKMLEVLKNSKNADGSDTYIAKYVKYLETCDEVVTIEVLHKAIPGSLATATAKDVQNATNGKGSDSTIRFSPNTAGNYSDGTSVDATGLLGHEIVHALMNAVGINEFDEDGVTEEKEAEAAGYENQYRVSKGIKSQRKWYGITRVPQYDKNGKQIRDSDIDDLTGEPQELLK